jgi:hypothetical protein
MKIENKKNVIEIQDEVKISQEGKDVILERGDKIKILEDDMTYEQAMDLKNSINLNGLQTKMRTIGIKTPSIDIDVVKYRSGPRLVCTISGFSNQDIGIFSSVLKNVVVRSDSRFNREENSWYSNWEIRYDLIDGGSNGITLFRSLYDFNRGTWEFFK